MKKIVCCLICVFLILTSSGLAATTVTLPQKVQNQLNAGSGLKGSLIIHAEGNDPLILALQPFQDVELQFRSMKNGDQLHCYMYQAGAEETQHGLTELFQNDNQLYFRSDLLPNEVYRIPGMEDLADLMLPARGGNPSLGSALLRLFQLSETERNNLLQPVTALMENHLEMWVDKYASVSAVRELEAGGNGIDLTYSIPMADLKQEIVHLLDIMSQTEEGQALLNRLMNPEQKETYANPNLDYYYNKALEALANDYDIQYSRTVSMLGNPVSSILELPLDEEKTGWQSLVIEDHGGLVSYSLRSDEQQITLMMSEWPDWSQISEMNIWIYIRPGTEADDADKNAFHALRFTVSHSAEESADEENYSHLRETWKISAQRDVSRLPEGENPEDYPEEYLRELELSLHYFSKYSQSSPTTLEADFKLSLKDMSLTANCHMITSSRWMFSPFNIEQATDLTALSGEELTLKLAEFLAAAGEQLIPAADVDQSNSEEEKETDSAETAMPDAASETVDDISEKNAARDDLGPEQDLESTLEQKNNTESQKEEFTEQDPAD